MHFRHSTDRHKVLQTDNYTVTTVFIQMASAANYLPIKETKLLDNLVQVLGMEDMVTCMIENSECIWSTLERIFSINFPEKKKPLLWAQNPTQYFLLL